MRVGGKLMVTYEAKLWLNSGFAHDNQLCIFVGGDKIQATDDAVP
jgi:hypothetical protein